MVILPETITETQNKFLLFYAIGGLKHAIEKTGVSEALVRKWLQRESFKQLMDEIQDSYLALASLELKKLTIDVVRRVEELVHDRSEKFDRDRASFLLKTLDTIRTFTISTDMNSLLKQVQSQDQYESRFKGVSFDVEELG